MMCAPFRDLKNPANIAIRAAVICWDMMQTRLQGGESMLMAASARNAWRCGEWLLEHGVTANGRNDDGLTSLLLCRMLAQELITVI
jgi:hypothetical protein